MKFFSLLRKNTDVEDEIALLNNSITDIQNSRFCIQKLNLTGSNGVILTANAYNSKGLIFAGFSSRIMIKYVLFTSTTHAFDLVTPKGYTVETLADNKIKITFTGYTEGTLFVIGGIWTVEKL